MCYLIIVLLFGSLCFFQYLQNKFLFSSENEITWRFLFWWEWSFLQNWKRVLFTFRGEKWVTYTYCYTIIKGRFSMNGKRHSIFTVPLSLKMMVPRPFIPFSLVLSFVLYSEKMCSNHWAFLFSKHNTHTPAFKLNSLLTICFGTFKKNIKFSICLYKLSFFVLLSIFRCNLRLGVEPSCSLGCGKCNLCRIDLSFYNNTNIKKGSFNLCYSWRRPSLHNCGSGGTSTSYLNLRSRNLTL